MRQKVQGIAISLGEGMAMRILLVWVGCLLGFGAFILLIPHEGIPASALLSIGLQTLLFIISVAIYRREPTRKNKVLFLNFSFLFGTSVLSFPYFFLDTILPSEPFAKFYANQYVAFGAYMFFLAFAIVYLTIDSVFRDFSLVKKYVLAAFVVVGFFFYYYQGYLADPRYLYSTADIQDWRTLDRAAEEYRLQTGLEPTEESLSESTEMYYWRDGKAIGVLFPEEKQARIAELFPYLHGENYKVLLWKPLYMNVIYMCVLSIGFIFMYFGYQYRKDPPQGAYIEKIMFMFLLFCALEILHAWSFVKSVEWQTFFSLVQTGQYFSVLILMLIAVFFMLRLRWITSVNGEFYEQEIVTSPGSITRLRDAIDNLLIAHFFNRDSFLGRFFVDPGRKGY